jgi:DNA-binding MarR family transcriptional regulator
MVDMNFSGEPPLGFLLHRVAAALRAEVTATALDPLNLTFAEYICLRMLSIGPGKSNADLARDVNVSPQAMNIVLRGLQERGLVLRPAAAASGRSRPAELTAEGVAVLKRTDAGVRAAEHNLLGRLAEDDRAPFRRMLAELA